MICALGDLAQARVDINFPQAARMSLPDEAGGSRGSEDLSQHFNLANYERYFSSSYNNWGTDEGTKYYPSDSSYLNFAVNSHFTDQMRSLGGLDHYSEDDVFYEVFDSYYYGFNKAVLPEIEQGYLLAAKNKLIGISKDGEALDAEEIRLLEHLNPKRKFTDLNETQTKFQRLQEQGKNLAHALLLYNEKYFGSKSVINEQEIGRAPRIGGEIKNMHLSSAPVEPQRGNRFIQERNKGKPRQL